MSHLAVWIVTEWKVLCGSRAMALRARLLQQDLKKKVNAIHLHGRLDNKGESTNVQT